MGSIGWVGTPGTRICNWSGSTCTITRLAMVGLHHARCLWIESLGLWIVSDPVRIARFSDPIALCSGNRVWVRTRPRDTILRELSSKRLSTMTACKGLRYAIL